MVLMLAAAAFTTSLFFNLSSARQPKIAPRRHGSPLGSTSCATAAPRHAFLPQSTCATYRGRVGQPRVAQAHDESRANRRRCLSVTSESQESPVFLMLYTMWSSHRAVQSCNPHLVVETVSGSTLPPVQEHKTFASRALEVLQHVDLLGSDDAETSLRLHQHAAGRFQLQQLRLRDRSLCRTAPLLQQRQERPPIAAPPASTQPWASRPRYWTKTQSREATTAHSVLARRSVMQRLQSILSSSVTLLADTQLSQFHLAPPAQGSHWSLHATQLATNHLSRRRHASRAFTLLRFPIPAMGPALWSPPLPCCPSHGGRAPIVPFHSLFSKRFPPFLGKCDDPTATFPSPFPLLSVSHLCLPLLSWEGATSLFPRLFANRHLRRVFIVTPQSLFRPVPAVFLLSFAVQPPI